MRRLVQTLTAGVLVLATGALAAAQEKPPAGPKQTSKDLVPKKPEAPAKGEPQQIAGKTLEQWIADIRDPDPGVRMTALQTLPQFPSARLTAVRAVLTEFNDRDPSLRANAVVALGSMGIGRAEDVEPAIKALARLLSDPQQIVRYRAATVLGGFGPAASTAIPQLANAFKDPYASFETRKVVVFALGQTGRPRPEPTASAQADQSERGPNSQAVHAVIDALKDYCSLVRLEAVKAFIYLGKPASTAQRQAVRTALWGVLRDRDRTVSIWAYVALMSLDKVTEEYLKDIARYLKSSHPPTRMQAAEALAAVGSPAHSRLSDLLSALDDRDPDVVIACLGAIPHLLPGKKVTDETLEPIARLLRSPNAQLRVQAALTLATIGPDAGGRTSDLVAALKDAEPAVVVAALAALVQMGPAARSALPEVEKLTKHKSLDVQRGAQQAIEYIKKMPGAKMADPAGKEK
jgi:HEAT repeat protein